VRLSFLYKGLSLLVFGAAAAVAGTVCPASPGTGVAGPNGAFAHSPDAAATGCNVVITINANGSISTTVPDSQPYDGSEDTLVGVVNNSASPVGSLNISGSGIFDLDGDGHCTYTFTGNSYCAGAAASGTDPQDYYGPNTTFANIAASTDSGTVAFNPPVGAGGGTSYFSLENPPTASLTVTVGPTLTPAPGTFVLLGIGIALLCGWTLRSQLKNRLFAR
jgi:hypothetical protein